MKLILLSTALIFGVAIAEESEPLISESPIEIKADRLKIIDQGALSVYEGNVSVKQADIHIFADKIELRTEDEVIQTLIAHGSPVRLKNTTEEGEFSAKSDRLSYNLKSGWVKLWGGSPEVMHLENHIQGKTIRFHVDRDDIEAEGEENQPVQLRINPTNFQ